MNSPGTRGSSGEAKETEGIPGAPVTILDALNKGTLFLEKKGVPDARQSMQILAAHVLACDRMALYMDFDKPMTQAQLSALRKLTVSRGERQPVQHLTGTVEFFNRTFKSDTRALIPRPETEELAGKILSRLFGNGLRILDVGTGSGALGLTLALELGGRCKDMTLTDLSPEALELARKNAALQGIEASLIETDLLEGLSGGWHLIAANLPYIAESERGSLSPEVLMEPESALFGGPDGLAHIRELIPQAAEKLAPGGLLALETGHAHEHPVRQLLTENGFTSIEIESDLSGIARFPFARTQSK